jgi:hypothetical protein
MWPFTKRLSAWLMNETKSLVRGSPQSQALYFGYEKAGLTLHDAAIPWNADNVVVEASLLKLTGAQQRKADFTLRLPLGESIAAESLRPEEAGERHRLIFRLPTPAHSTEAGLFWRERQLGRIDLPILSAEEYINGLRVDMPSFFVKIGHQTVACQTFVATQCRGWSASAQVTSRALSLAPLFDLGLNVQFRNERDGSTHEVMVTLAGSQMQTRQALISASPRKLPKRIGAWTATWRVGDLPLASQRVRAISQRYFQNSLRISDTRFVAMDRSKRLSVRRQLPPLTEVMRLGPCFHVASREPGMAGLCQLQVFAQVPGGVQAPLLLEQELLVTDGPTMFTPGTVDVADLQQVSAFELRMRTHTIGVLPLSPVPTASFNNEGGFQSPPDFLWTSAADEELTERLNRLMGGGRN